MAEPEDHGWNSCFLEMTSDQTHGLVTYRSQGDEQGEICQIFTAALEYLWRIDCVGLTLAVFRGNALKARRELTYATLVDQFFQPVYREIGIQIFKMGRFAIPEQVVCKKPVWRVRYGP